MTTREKKTTVAVRSPILKRGAAVTVKNLPSVDESLRTSIHFGPEKSNIEILFEQSLDYADRITLDEEETTAMEIDPKDVELLQLLMK